MDEPFSFTAYVSGFMFEVFLYAMGLLFFSAAAYTLVFNLKSFSRWPLLATAATMFAIATTNVSMSLYILFGFVIHGRPIPFRIVQLRHIFYLLNNLIADGLLIYRCFVIWTRSIRVIIAPCILFLASIGFGIFYVSSSSPLIRDRRYIYMWLALGFNISVTGLIATRIWWMAREARKILGPMLAKKYYSGLVIIIESGAIYCLYVLVDQILKTVISRNLFFLDAGLTQVVAIAPTLIIVQVGLGRQARDVDSTLQVGFRETSEIVLTTVHTH